MTTGGGVAGLQLVAKSAPDGYTLAMLTGGFATQAAVLKNLQYDPMKDFVFITSVVRYPMVYTVRPDLPIKSFKDMIERAKASGKVSYGIVGAGNVYHLLGKWIDNAAGVEMNAVPYRGTALALQDVLAGGRCAERCRHQHDPARAERPDCARSRCPRPSPIRCCRRCRPWRRRCPASNSSPGSALRRRLRRRGRSSTG